jgi:hypothetical protein
LVAGDRLSLACRLTYAKLSKAIQNGLFVLLLLRE